MDLSGYDVDTMFSAQSIRGETHCADRVRLVLHVYRRWIHYTKSLEEEEEQKGDGPSDRIDIVDLMEDELPQKYSFTDFQVDFGRILKNGELLKVKGTVIESECAASDCFILRRHQRPKDYYSRNGHKMDSLFFAENGDDGRRGVVVQQCLDSVHHYLEHRESVDIQSVAESLKAKDAQTEPQDVDLDDLCKDRLVIALDRELAKRTDSRPSRGRGIEQEQFNKFMTTNTYISTTATAVTVDPDDDAKGGGDDQVEAVPAAQQEVEEEIECEDCFVEQLFNEMVLHGLDLETVLKLRRLVLEQQFDTDSVVADCDTNDAQKGAGGQSKDSAVKQLLHSLSA